LFTSYFPEERHKYFLLIFDNKYLDQINLKDNFLYLAAKLLKILTLVKLKDSLCLVTKHPYLIRKNKMHRTKTGIWIKTADL
jgi:hypothetical protein